MKTYIFWNGKYKGVVGGGLWDNFLVNARAGHGKCTLVDATSVTDAKSRLGEAKATKFPNVFAHGGFAFGVVLKFA